MMELIEFLVKGITGSQDFEVEERSEGERTEFVIHANQDYVGKIIGKEGRTIKALRNILKVRATLEKKLVGLSVVEKEV